MCATYTGLTLTVVRIKEILKALNNFLAAAKTENCFCSEILLFQSNPGPADLFTNKFQSDRTFYLSEVMYRLSLFMLVFFFFNWLRFSYLFFSNENGNTVKAAQNNLITDELWHVAKSKSGKRVFLCCQ